MTALSKPIVVGVTGPADVRTIDKLHAQLKKALKKQTDVCLQLAADTDVDLTFVQLVEAARRLAAGAGKTLAFETPASGLLREILERGGFLKTADNRAFWLHDTGAR